MSPQLSSRAGLEPDAAVTGTFGVSLTRAVLPYSDEPEGYATGGRIHDIGMGVVIDGADPARAEILDLGSAELRIVNLAGPVALLGWLYPSGLRSLRRVVDDFDDDSVERSRSLTFQVALRILKGVGFGALTRPTLLRIGFRDLCQDLDLHEDTAVRLKMTPGGVVRTHLDYEAATLIVRTGRLARDIHLEAALEKAFPHQECLGGTMGHPAGTFAYHVPFATPRSLTELRDLLGVIRSGLVTLLARFEPGRYQTQRDMSVAFGERDSLRSLEERRGVASLEQFVIGETRAARGSRGVH